MVQCDCNRIVNENISLINSGGVHPFIGCTRSTITVLYSTDIIIQYNYNVFLYRYSYLLLLYGYIFILYFWIPIIHTCTCVPLWLYHMNIHDLGLAPQSCYSYCIYSIMVQYIRNRDFNDNVRLTRSGSVHPFIGCTRSTSIHKVAWFRNQQKKYWGLNQSKINIFEF